MSNTFATVCAAVSLFVAVISLLAQAFRGASNVGKFEQRLSDNERDVRGLKEEGTGIKTSISSNGAFIAKYGQFMETQGFINERLQKECTDLNTRISRREGRDEVR